MEGRWRGITSIKISAGDDFAGEWRKVTQVSWEEGIVAGWGRCGHEDTV